MAVLTANAAACSDFHSSGARPCSSPPCRIGSRAMPTASVAATTTN